MARTPKDDGSGKPGKAGRGGKAGKSGKAAKESKFAQLKLVYSITRQTDRALPWFMLAGLLAPVALGFAIGLLFGHEIYGSVLGLTVGTVIAMLIMARRAERAAYARLAGQAGAAQACLGSLRRGWSVEEQPVGVDPRTQDLVFRVVGRPGVVLVTEGPSGRAGRLAELERKRVARVLPNVPIQVVHSGDDEGQVPLPRLNRTLTKMKPALTKAEVSEVAKRLRALGAARPPIPKGIDPLRARPDRKVTRGR